MTGVANKDTPEAAVSPERPDLAPFSLAAAIEAQARAAFAASANQDPARAVYDARRALKRVRVLARLARRTAPEPADAIEHAARAAMRRLSDARECAALEDMALSVAKEAEPQAAAALRSVAAALAIRARRLQHPALAQAQPAIAFAVARAAVFPAIDATDVAEAAARLARRAVKAREKARLESKPSARHEWRKREKDRVNAIVLLQSAWPRALPKRLKEARALADALGRERDAALLMLLLIDAPQLAGDAADAEAAIAAAKRMRLRMREKADDAAKRLRRGG
jgi:hypothetical protein